MSYGDYRLYLYDNTVDLVISSDRIYVDNRPMNNRTLTAHKGLTNELLFNIRNKDRKLQNVFSDTLSAYLINPTTKKRLFYKLLEHTGTVGQVKLVLDEGDLRNVADGLYTMYIARQLQDGTDLPVYANQNNDIKFDIRITEQIDQTPVATQVNTSFLQVANTNAGDSANIYATSALFGNQDRNFPNALHSIAIYTENYTGNIDIQGSCIASTPNSDDESIDWFTIENDISLTAESNIVHRTFTVNANWIRIMHTPVSGNITQVQLRN